MPETSVERSTWLKNVMELKQLEKMLQKTLQVIEKSANETEVEWLQLIALSNELKGESEEQCEMAEQPSARHAGVEDQAKINQIPLDFQFQPKLNHYSDEEFDSD